MKVSITPWKRFGHDRIYAAVDGRKVGYRDNANGTEHPEREGDAALLTALLGAHPTAATATAPHLDRGQADRGAAAATLDNVEEHEAARVPVRSRTPQQDLTWTDLAHNVRGQAARERASEEWEFRKAAMPVRAVLGRLVNVHTDERAWRIGADGEAHVGAQLEKLARKDPRWRVLHAVPVGERGSDIDHVVIGPAGVFTINTKNHPGAKVWVGKDQLRVNGHTQPYIRNSRFEA